MHSTLINEVTQMAKTHDHEIVSIYPFTDEEVDQLMNNSVECVLMWSTKDGWPVGVTHSFVWHEQKIWLTFAEHRHRTAAIRRDNRVSINVSSRGYPAGASRDLPGGAITFKGTGELFDDDDTKKWFYTALSSKLNPDNEAGEEFFYNLLDSPLRLVMAVTPVKKIMYNGKTAGAHMVGTVSEDELGERLSADAERMNKAREKRGLPPR
jgi:hypothetical protein